MDKVLEKDFQNLKIKANIKRFGSKMFSIPKIMGQKLFNNFKKVQSSLKTVVNEEVKQEYKDQNVSKIDEQLDAKNQLAQAVISNDELSYEDKTFYLKEIKKDYNKLLAKKAKVSNKGLGVFALSKVTLTQITNNTKLKLNTVRAKAEDAKQKQKLEDAKNELLEYQKMIKDLQDQINNLNGQIGDVQNNIKDLVKEYPELEISENTNEETQVKTM